ncbi:hexokinase [soil metagenome]
MSIPQFDFGILDNLGLRRLTDQEVKASSATYRKALQNGVQGLPSSLKMFPSCLSPVDLPVLKDGVEALILEVGGTNLYGARVKMSNHKPLIISAYKTPIEKIVFTSAQEFFETIITQLSPVMGGRSPDAISIVYSFAGQPVKSSNGVDVISAETLTKEFVIPGISQKGVGVQFIEAFTRHHTVLVKDQPVVVLNDTVATLFASGARIGGVDGTGFNLALLTPIGIVNSESGGFNGVPLSELSRIIDKRSLDPGNYLAEKQISGAYLSEQLKEIVRMLTSSGISLPYDESITGEVMSEIFGYTGEDEGLLILKEAARRMGERSAQIVGLMVGSIFSAFPEIYTTDEEAIPIEGSVFWNIPGYQDEVLRTVEALTNKKVTFLNIAEAGRLGAAVAALSFLKNI